MRSPVRINDSPGMCPAHIEEKNTLEFGHIHNLKPGCKQKLRARCRLTVDVRGPRQFLARLTVGVQLLGPRLEGYRTGWTAGEAGPQFPISRMAGRYAQI